MAQGDLKDPCAAQRDKLLEALARERAAVKRAFAGGTIASAGAMVEVHNAREAVEAARRELDACIDALKRKRS